MTKEEKRKQLIVTVGEELFYDIKGRATKNKSTVRLWVIGAILDKIIRENKGEKDGKLRKIVDSDSRSSS
jgi:hypothetical protein